MATPALPGSRSAIFYMSAERSCSISHLCGLSSNKKNHSASHLPSQGIHLMPIVMLKRHSLLFFFERNIAAEGKKNHRNSDHIILGNCEISLSAAQKEHS